MLSEEIKREYYEYLEECYNKPILTIEETLEERRKLLIKGLDVAHEVLESYNQRFNEIDKLEGDDRKLAIELFRKDMFELALKYGFGIQAIPESYKEVYTNEIIKLYNRE